MAQKKDLPSLNSNANLLISRGDVEQIRKNLNHKPRDLLLFDLATQTGMKMKDLLRMRVKDLKGLNIGETLPVAKGKENSSLPIILTETIFQTFQAYINQINPDAHDYLFRSRKGTKPLSISSTSSMVSEWLKEADIKGAAGTRSLRRIWKLFYQNSSGNRNACEKKGSFQFLGPVKRTTLQETVYQELLQAIVSGRILPGDSLTTKKIARQMEVSEMPVREALGRLAASGFISLKKKKSSIVNELSRDNLMEIMEIRLALETIAVKKACLSRSEATLERLEALHRQYIKATNDYDVDEILRINKIFHHAIYKDANMPILQRIIESLWDQISPYFHILMRDSYFPYKDVNAMNHGQILKALKQKNVKDAVTWLRTDLNEAANLVFLEFEHR